MKIPRLMLITNGQFDNVILEKLIFACEIGLPAIQLREKEAETKDLLAWAMWLREATAKYHQFFTINERLDIALLVNADGVHFPEEGLSPQTAKKLKPSLIVGVSVHSLQKGQQAEQEGADYVLFGPIFPTSSKCPKGLWELSQVSKALKIPVLAVGGITPSLARQCIEAGAYGIAAISAFFLPVNLKETIHQFLQSHE